MAMQITAGNRNWSWWAMLHRLDRPSIDLTPAIVGATTRKTLGDPAGTFSLTLKPTFAPGGQQADLLHEIADDDWLTIGATDPAGMDWIVSVSLVDSVRRSRSGSAAVTTYSLQGRDLGKILQRTDLLDMPWLGSGLEKLWGNSAVAQEVLNSQRPRSPGAMVKALVRYGLAAAEYRLDDYRFWSVPQSVDIRPIGRGVPLDMRQASDVIALDHIDPDQQTRGEHIAAVALPSGMSAGGSLWAMMVQLQNPLLNELHYDVIALPGAERSASAYSARRGEQFSARPAIRMREKPFPALGVSENRWGRLPVNVVREADLESYDVGRSGAERFSWYSVEPGGGDEMATLGAIAMMQGRVAPEDRWDAMPAILQTAIERHGLSRYQQPTPYLSPELSPQDVFFGQQWVRLLRDWYAPNPVFLSGRASIACLCPGIRIGERLRVLMASGAVEEFYIEGVDHRFNKLPGGSAHGSTTLSITRGWRLPSVDAEYHGAVLAWLRDNLESMR